jgi:membrane carboxypeptidase/penicillin-binding protein PbpC
VEIKCQLDATDEFLLQILLFPQHVSGTFMPIISSPQTGHTTLNSTLYRQLENQAQNTTDSNRLYDTLELLMMGLKVPETCLASNKICIKNPSVASSWHFIST